MTQLNNKSQSLSHALCALAYIHADSGKTHEEAKKITQSIQSQERFDRPHSHDDLGNISNDSINPINNNNNIFDLQRAQSDIVVRQSSLSDEIFNQDTNSNSAPSSNLPIDFVDFDSIFSVLSVERSYTLILSSDSLPLSCES